MSAKKNRKKLQRAASRARATLLQDRRGMSLIEVMVAILLLGMVTVPLVGLFTAGATHTAVARHDVAALNFAQEMMEGIKGMSFDQIGNPPAENQAGNQITLAEGTKETNFGGWLIAITDGKGKGQVRTITGIQPGNPPVATVSPAWDANQKPDATSSYLICPGGAFGLGTAQGGGQNTITLAANETAEDNFYNGYFVAVAGGTGAGQERKITGYNGNTKVATVDHDWAAPPDSTSIYRLNPYKYNITIEQDGNSPELKKVTVTAFYQTINNLERNVSLTTDKLRR